MTTLAEMNKEIAALEALIEAEKYKLKSLGFESHFNGPLMKQIDDETCLIICTPEGTTPSAKSEHVHIEISCIRNNV